MRNGKMIGFGIHILNEDIYPGVCLKAGNL